MSGNYEIAERLTHLFLDGAAAVGRMIGVPKSTIAEWKGELSRWSADKLLAMADADEALRMALLARLGASPKAQSGRAETCAKTVVRDAGEAIAVLMSDLDDGVITSQEAKNHLSLVRRLARDVEQLERAYAEKAGVR